MKIIFQRQAHKFIKKSSSALKEKIKNEVLKIKENPNIGRQLSGKLKGIKSHRFLYRTVSYRVAYFVKNDIVVITITSRENFYKDLRI